MCTTNPPINHLTISIDFQCYHILYLRVNRVQIHILTTRMPLQIDKQIVLFTHSQNAIYGYYCLFRLERVFFNNHISGWLLTQ